MMMIFGVSPPPKFSMNSSLALFSMRPVALYSFLFSSGIIAHHSSRGGGGYNNSVPQVRGCTIIKQQSRQQQQEAHQCFHISINRV